MIKPIRLALPAFAVVAALVPAAARAQVVTPQPPPTIITTQPYTINAPGYYQLGANLVSNAASGDIITINSGNVTLDFAGHYISGPSDANSSSTINGVHAYEKGNINIRNGTIAYCYRGINLDGSGSSSSLNINQRVENMLVSYCFYESVRLSYTSNSMVSDCRVSFTGNNTTNPTIYALYTYGGAGNQFLNNTVINTIGTGSGTAYGIYASTDTAVIGNLISTVSSPGGTAYGIYQGAFVDHNKVNNCQYGIYAPVKYSDNLTANCTTAFAGGGTAAGYNN